MSSPQVTGTNNKSSSLFGSVDADILERSIIYHDEQIRLDSLALICENPKTTEPILSVEFELVKKFLYFNSDSLSPSFRQSIISSLKKVYKPAQKERLLRQK